MEFQKISWNHGFSPFVAFLKIKKVWLEREWDKCFVGSPSKSCQPPLTGSRYIWNIMWISGTINKGSARYNSNNWVLEVFLAVSSSGDLIKIYFCRSRHVTPPEVCGENKLWTEPQFPIISRKRKIECFRSTKSLKRGEIMSFCRSSTLRTLS